MLNDNVTELSVTGPKWQNISNTSGNISSSFWYSPISYYYYQIFCPNKKCKQVNWLELDKITPCNNCGKRLKAVLEQADYEVPVTR